MKNNSIKEMICILDQSGSMYGREEDTIRSYNDMLKEQKQQEGEAYITTALFSDQCHILYRHMPIRQAEALTQMEYYAYGNTALFDAIGTVFEEVEPEKDEKVLVFIMTDGMENASIQYDQKKVRHLIQEKQRKGWEILFFGTEMRILDLAEETGIKKEHTMYYSKDFEGIRTGYELAGNRFSEIRKEK